MFTIPSTARAPMVPVFGQAPVASAPDFSQPPQNDDELRSYLQSAAGTIKGLEGPAQKAFADTVYSNIASFSQANPGSTIARTALDAAHQNAPAGHQFPTIGPQSPPSAPAAMPASLGVATNASNPPARLTNQNAPTSRYAGSRSLNAGGFSVYEK